MKVIIQRSKKANVTVDDKIVGSINQGLVLLVGFTINDTIKEIDYIVDKIVNLRIFDDEKGIMNKSVLDINGGILSISQFTLYADTKKGRRPSYINALNSNDAIKLYEEFNNRLAKYKIKIATGIFGANMQVSLTNDGPITIILEKNNDSDS